MDSTFNPHEIERKLYSEWEQAGYFSPSPAHEQYSIVIPPPNVTGSLHMGHAFQHTLMDALIRYQRMKGNETLWQMGKDHAGIATQMLVERQLISEGSSRHEIGREKFLERVWDWCRQSDKMISKQLRRMGSSVDWSRDRFTLDDGFSEAVIEVFVRLYNEGLIYRGQRLVNWDPHLKTAISDLEVENFDEKGYLWHFRYPLSNGEKTKEGENHLVVATTRPETMLGDTAVAVNPMDERYANLVGKTVKLPIVNRELPIIADEYVDTEFGTGCVKITPAHDFNDNLIGQKHGLDMISILNADGTLNDKTPTDYQGLDRFVAREKIISDIKEIGLLDKIIDHDLKIPRGDRSGEIIEPMLTDQWFVKIQPLAEPAIQAVENGDIKFIPKQYENLYFSWMRNIQDWTISRQQWWGHQIPAFFDDAGNVYVGKSEEEVRKHHQLGKDIALRQEEDVLETWFSSALWSFATMGWPESTEWMEKFHPTNVLVTGHDIIFFWVARMIMLALKFTGEVPFKEVYIHGLVRDAEGQKMSKTKGNGIDPLDLIDGIKLNDLVEKRTRNLTQPQLAPKIEKATKKDFPAGIPSYGTDALRFTFCALASTGRDVRFDLNRIEGYRNFCNKMWNAARFVIMNSEKFTFNEKKQYSLADQWIITKMNRMIKDAHKAISNYRFDVYANTVHEFVWHEYCDWYLEFTKPMLWNKELDPALLQGTLHTLLTCLETLLRVAHPVIPFITESIWTEVAPMLNKKGPSIMLEPFPDVDEDAIDHTSESAIEWLKEVILGLRNIRGEANIKPSTEINVLFQGGTNNDRQLAQATKSLLQRLAKVEEINWLETGDTAPPHSLALVNDLKIMVPLAGLIDVTDEKARLQKEIERKKSDLNRIKKKLSNPNFVSKAPKEVVSKEQQKADELENSIDILVRQAAALDQI